MVAVAGTEDLYALAYASIIMFVGIGLFGACLCIERTASRSRRHCLQMLARCTAGETRSAPCCQSPAHRHVWVAQEATNIQFIICAA